MMFKGLKLAALALVVGFSVAGCADGYGRSGVGYGSGYYGGYGDVGYGYGASSYGWYGDYYYPGNGVYVFDRYQRRYRWNDGQRAYWQGRRGNQSFGGDRGRPSTYGDRGDRGPIDNRNGARAPGTPGFGDGVPQGGRSRSEASRYRDRDAGQGGYGRSAPGARPSGGRQSSGDGRHGGRGRR